MSAAFMIPRVPMMRHRRRTLTFCMEMRYEKEKKNTTAVETGNRAIDARESAIATLSAEQIYAKK